MSNQLANATAQKAVSTTVRSMLNNESLKQRFQQVLGDNAPSFMASVVNATNSNQSLAKCEPNSVWASALVAAALKLPIDQNLGFAYIIPYKNKGVDTAQFQMGYKGFIQLAIRSGQYKDMGVEAVYEDEIKSHNPITGVLEFTDVKDWKQRYSDKGNVVGYYAYFTLTTGFTKSLYWSKAQVTKHAKTYSQTFKKGFGNWVENFDAMAKKTVLKNLLSHYGIMSIEIQSALTNDQASYKDVDSYERGEPTYDDNNEKTIDIDTSNAVDVDVDIETGEIKQEEPQEPAEQVSNTTSSNGPGF